jgi:hypothetical protein
MLWLSAETPSAVDLSGCEAVSIAAWWRASSPSRRARMAVVRLLKWPALMVAPAVGLSVLAIVAPMMFPFVWLTPSPEPSDVV